MNTRRALEMLNAADPLSERVPEESSAGTDWRRKGAALAVGSGIALVSVLLIWQLSPLEGAEQPKGTHAAVSGGYLPIPTLHAPPGWLSASTQPVVRSTEFEVPRTWVSNQVFSPGDLVSDGTIPLGAPTLPESTLGDLAEDGIVLAASTPLPNEGPIPSTMFPARTLPMTIGDAEKQSTWEGQPRPAISRYRLGATLQDGLKVEVFVFFGTQEPNPSLLNEADTILRSLEMSTAP
jgi:hypothetical protein